MGMSLELERLCKFTTVPFLQRGNPCPTIEILELLLRVDSTGRFPRSVQLSAFLDEFEVQRVQSSVTVFKDQPADYPFGGGSLLLGKASISDRLSHG